MIRTRWFCLLAVIAILIAAPAFAADEKKSDAPDKKHSENTAELFDKLDANHDGFITTDEVPAEQRHLFDRLLRQDDKDGDGKLSREEFVAGMSENRKDKEHPAGPPGDRPKDGPGMPPGPRGPGDRLMMGAAIFRTLDTNEDGKLDEKEIAAASESLKKLAKNGEITREDVMEYMRDKMNSLAEEGGRPPELSAEEAAKRMIKRFDKNGDGKLDKDELPKRALAHLEEMDTNHDGVVDEEELKAAMPKLMELRQAAEGPGGKRQKPGAEKKQAEENPKNK